MEASQVGGHVPAFEVSGLPGHGLTADEVAEAVVKLPVGVTKAVLYRHRQCQGHNDDIIDEWDSLSADSLCTVVVGMVEGVVYSVIS